MTGVIWRVKSVSLAVIIKFPIDPFSLCSHLTCRGLPVTRDIWRHPLTTQLTLISGNSCDVDSITSVSLVEGAIWNNIPVSPSCLRISDAGEISRMERNEIHTLEIKSRNNTMFHCTVSSPVTSVSLTRIASNAIDVRRHLFVQREISFTLVGH